MADEPKGGDPDKAKIDNKESGAGTDPTKTSSPASTDKGKTKDGENAFDEKVFDDPRLWTHPRFKSLNERAKKADELEKAQSEAEEKRLQEAKKFEELANKRAQERDEVKSKYTQSLQDNRIITEATKIGVVDIEAVLKLVDRSNIRIDDNGIATGVVEAVQALVTDKPYLKGKANVTIGSPTNPGADADNQPKKFKLSQLQDATFYRDNEKDIAEAYKAGLIEDDMH
ncbi:MAG: hypothetical protein JW735_06990 [Prolixibacteraceae bacterium]|nr:hypothetical protein [Prolixibacteraceae bacterium]